jgi:hypothetical protein
VEIQLEALRPSVALVQDLVLGDVDVHVYGRGAARGRIDAMAANWILWGSDSTLVTVVSHFPELETGLEVLESQCNACLTLQVHMR